MASEQFVLGPLTLRNRLVGTPHGRGLVVDGLATADDAAYWGRCAAGGASMLTVGGTVTAPESTWRRRITSEAWRPDAQEGMALRAAAIRAEGAIAACQLVHLGRETLGLDSWFHPVAPSAVRSPREATRPRALTEGEVDAIVEGFRTSAVIAHEAGFQVIELHAAHGYLLAQFLSSHTNHRPDAQTAGGRVAIVARVVDEIRAAVPAAVLGIRLSTEGGEEAGFTLDGLCELLPLVDLLVDYINLTVGVRSTYVRDMAVVQPPLLADIARVRPLVAGPLLVSHSFRGSATIEAALAAGSDLVGLARPLIADPDLPNKLLAGREAAVRPCVSCNEDCRAFDPALLCSVNPDLGPTAAGPRPAAPLVVAHGDRSDGPVAIVGAGPGGLECALRLAGRRAVTLFDAQDTIGGQLAVAAASPNRSGWRALLAFYADQLEGVDLRLGAPVATKDLDDFGEVVLALGSEEVRPSVPGIEHALTASGALAAGPSALSGVRRLLVVDDGFGWWPCASAVELGVAARCAAITVVTPGPAFCAALPPEARVQLLARLRGAPLVVRPLTTLVALDDGAAQLANGMSGAVDRLAADAVIVVGERRSHNWEPLIPADSTVRVIGDALVPRKVMHAIAEGRAAAADVLGAPAGAATAALYGA